MHSNKYFGSYYPVDSFIHKINPVIKLVALFLLLIPIIGSMELKLHVVMLFFTVMLLYSSKVPLRFYFNMLYGIRYLFILLLFLLASRGLDLETAVIVLLKIVILIEYLSLIFYTTSPNELKYGIEKSLSPFNFLSLNLGKFANVVVNIITFFPLLFVTEQKVLKSASMRGLDYYNQDILSKIYVASSSLKNTFRLTFERIKEEKFASTLRMYNVSKHRTNLSTNKINFNGIFLLLIHLIFVAYYIYERGLL